MTTHSIDDLLLRVSTALRALPGAVDLYLFGSLTYLDGKDAYADLDLQVLSADYDASRAAWPWILQRAGTIQLAYPISEKPRESAFTIAFEDESPYHKLDIGLSDRQNPAWFFSQIERKILVWRLAAPVAAPKAAPEAVQDMAVTASPGNAFVPESGSAAHFLTGELLSAVRYVKARKRGQHLTCWRFLSAKFNALLRCARWDGDPRQFPQGALTTWDFVALDQVMPEPERLDLFSGLDFRSPTKMDRALVDLTLQITERIEPGFRSEDTRAAALARDYLKFIEQELGVGA